MPSERDRPSGASRRYQQMLREPGHPLGRRRPGRWLRRLGLADYPDGGSRARSKSERSGSAAKNGFPGFQPNDAGESTAGARAVYVDLESKRRTPLRPRRRRALRAVRRLRRHARRQVRGAAAGRAPLRASRRAQHRVPGADRWTGQPAQRHHRVQPVERKWRAPPMFWRAARIEFAIHFGERFAMVAA